MANQECILERAAIDPDIISIFAITYVVNYFLQKEQVKDDEYRHKKRRGCFMQSSPWK